MPLSVDDHGRRATACTGVIEGSRRRERCRCGVVDLMVTNKDRVPIGAGEGGHAVVPPGRIRVPSDKTRSVGSVVSWKERYRKPSGTRAGRRRRAGRERARAGRSAGWWQRLPAGPPRGRRTGPPWTRRPRSSGWCAAQRSDLRTWCPSSRVDAGLGRCVDGGDHSSRCSSALPITSVRSAGVAMPSNPKPRSSELGVVMAAPTGKPAASVTTQSLPLAALPAGAPGTVQPSSPVSNDVGRAVGQRDVVDEGAEALGAPVAGVGDGHLDRAALPRRRGRRSSPASRRSCRTRRSTAPVVPVGRARPRRLVERLVVVELRVQLAPALRGSCRRSSWVVWPLASGSVVQSLPPGVRASTKT